MITIDEIKLEMKNCNIISTKKQKKYQHYLEHLINTNTLQGKNYYLLIKEW